MESITDRIEVGGQDISPHELTSLVEQLKPLFDEVNRTSLGPITQFEVTTLLALVYYQQRDWILWCETGLGGRLDATNVVRPLVSVITNIGYDHTEVLGRTLVAIAREKAGIIKQGVPVLTGVEDDEAWQAIAARAKALQAPIWRLGQDFACRRNWFQLSEQSFSYWDLYGELDDLRLHLLGEHQCRNAAMALAIVAQLRQQGFAIPDTACRTGLAAARWPGRLEIMRQKPLVIVDGAHNSHGTRILRQALEEYLPDRRIVMVLGILQGKNRQEMLAHLLPLAAAVIFTAPQSGRATDPALLLDEAQPYGIAAMAMDSVSGAVSKALDGLGPEDVLLIGGSLYIVSEARDYLHSIAQ